ncbi:NucA/NucB deoxyribonuclease domain-containing protein [Streptomyces sp. NPDC006879]|uniref:NucA/NucB deoxyribonuclease domain-containing protein n=1 Tax=Streptomyces sp. NPDC006879 TaxID=3364767 RepID=UPI0036BBC226
MSRRPLTSSFVRSFAAAAALAALITAPAAASPTPASDASQSSAPQAFVDASALPPALLRGLNRPVPFAEYAKVQHRDMTSAPAPVPSAASSETELRKKCALHTGSAKHPRGWIATRFTSCQKRPYDLVLRDVRGTRAIGRLWFDMWTLGFASDGERRVKYATSIENIRVQTVAGEDATKWRVGQHLRHDIYASGSDPDPRVDAPAVKERDELLGVWDRDPRWTLTYTSPDKGPLYARGNQQRVLSTISLDVTADSPNASPYSQPNAHYSNVRFDYAGPVGGKYKGTVFTQARVELILSRKDPKIKESTQHIYDALKRPYLTFPSFAGKSVPGDKEPLHRLVDATKQKDQRKKSISECKKVWGDYSHTGLECDEYPFASTKEGSKKGDNRFSVRLIDGGDNGEGGRRINTMYTTNRVLDDDPFYVKITN